MSQIIARAQARCLAPNYWKPSLQVSRIHLTSVLERKKAGRWKVSVKHDKPITYELYNRPDMIGVRKSWWSFNTSGLLDAPRKAATAQEDILMRKFIHGTWPKLVASDLVIKRTGNQIVISFMATRGIRPSSMYFLVGYTEEVLSYILKSVVKLELQTVSHQNDLTYKYV